jgi:glycosyltransferase involved in cell wall biosynthesis
LADPSIEKWFYIDQTLTQLIGSPGYAPSMSRSNISEAISFEKENYHAAKGIISHSNWAADSVVRHYGIDATKVHVAVPGANILPADYERWEPTSADNFTHKEQRLRASKPVLVFVGKDWRRKGLLTAASTVAAAQRLGLEPSLRVIGCDPAEVPRELRKQPGLEWYGFIDKRKDIDRFLMLVGQADFGCLFSSAEAGGMAIREYHSLGLPVLATAVGGIPEHVLPQASRLFPANVEPETVAEELKNLCMCDRDIINRAWQSRHTVLWSASLQRISSFWDAKTGILSEEIPNLT